MRARLEAFLRGEGQDALTPFLRLPLIPAGLVYGGLAALRRRLYSAGAMRVRRLPVPVISVGNLEIGGTGKTPFIRWLARRLEDRGERPLILARGYGSRARGDDLDEEGQSLARDLPEVTVVQGADRAAAVAPHLERVPGPTVVILDDGAQTLALARDAEVLLLDGARPLGAGWPLPAGSLREFPGWLLEHADLVLLTRADQAGPSVLDAALARLAVRRGARPLASAWHRPARLLPGGEAPDSLAGRSVYLVSGIARPDSFRRTAEGLGARVLGHRACADHALYALQDVREIEDAARAAGAQCVLGTGKDEPKFRRLQRIMPWAFLEVEVVPDHEGILALDVMLDRVLGERAR